MSTTKVIANREFTPASIAAVFCSVEIPGSSLSERRAAARAILRHKQHEAKQVTIPNDGLHPSYLELHGRGRAKDGELREVKMVLNDSFNDLLDAVSALDRIDGGVSLVLRCLGYEPSTKISPENITVDVHMSPRELADGGKKLTEHVALIVQAFGENVALPHLHRFQTRCISEGVQPLPAPVPGKQILIDGPSHLPPPFSKGGGYICCRCRPAGTLMKDIAIHNMPPGGSLVSQSTMVAKAPAEIVISDDEEWTSDAEAVASQYDYKKVVRSTNNRRKSRADGLHGALISIGPRTDAVFDRFGLPDSLIPRIRVLICEKYSNKWEKIFRSKPWGLTYEQADKLNQALLADIMADAQLPTMKRKSTCGYKFTLLLLATILMVFVAAYLL